MSKRNIFNLVIFVLLLVAFARNFYLGETLAAVANVGFLIGIALSMVREFYKEKSWLETASGIFLFTGLVLLIIHWVS